ncbi:viperin family antiviral radical SAM protein [Cupriavidus oxalaticus]|uniref:S-adenosylmethionine-dependent nucleotide dehydratase n=1 Tax=Cupriavidus oxalaticus TaxID=96344 RepID=A0A4P7LE94_9BURK|nr:viperin family antiviral radical SAM protein [Cupriavidus oxalaticus]QBY54446.1 radical SAM protein [Cupriavidus oxalaticus]
MHNPTPLVLNWHLTEACNYRCQYCYATWDESTCRRELIHDPERTTGLLNELYQFFRPGNRMNPLANRLAWSSVRLNLAGGEPLLHAGKLPSIVSQARGLGFEVSMISNGSQLNEELLNQLAPQLTWLGISIDSVNPATNRAIGRVDRRSRLLNLEGLASNLVGARLSNPGLRIKLNTVVNQLNHGEDLGSLIQCFAPQKWKVLRMLPVVNQHLAVSDEQFAAFVARHRTFARILCAEDNQDMRESYLMIDPHGRFFQSSPLIAGQGYAYSRPILEVGAGVAFSEMTFDHERFSARYIPVNTGIGA